MPFLTTIQQWLKLFLRRTFDIREGELSRALLMQLNIFLIITTLLIVKPTVNALFLSKFGVESLPYAFILVAFAAAIVSTLFSRLLNNYPLNKVMVTTLAGSVVSLLGFGLFLRYNILESFTLYFFYIWVAIFALLTTSQFWILANIVFNAREAKRLFGFIGAGAIAGGILGGYLTSVLSQMISSEFLPYICTVFLVFCIPITQWIWKSEVSPKQRIITEGKHAPHHSDHPLTLILQSKHLTYIAAIVGVSVIVAKLVDYQFGGIAAELIPDPDELTAFFGFWFSTFSVISLLMQLFVTRRIISTFGVGVSLLFLPLSILLATIILFLMPELLLAAVFLKMSDGSLKQSVNKAAMELLILPISQAVKNKTKTFIDVFIDSLATGISGLMLIFLVKGLNLSTNAINLLILFFLLIWIGLVYLVRKEYIRSFRMKINFLQQPKKRKLKLKHPSTIKSIKHNLKHGTETQILYLLDQIHGVPGERFSKEVAQLVDHSSEVVRAKAIGSLSTYRSTSFSDQIAALRHDPSEQVQLAVFAYFLKKAASKNTELIQAFLHHEVDNISYAALVELAKESKQAPQLRALFQLEDLLKKKIEYTHSITDETQRVIRTNQLLQAIGYAGNKAFYPFLEAHLNNLQSASVVRAIRSAGDTGDPHFLDPLILYLGDDHFQMYARQALLKFGKNIVSLLTTVARDPYTSIKIVRAIPSIIKHVNSQRSVDFLFELLDYEDDVVQREALRGLNLLHNTQSGLVFHKKTVLHQILNKARLYQEMLSVLYTQNNIHHADKVNLVHHKNRNDILQARAGLIHLLEKQLDHNLERIFRLLGLKHSSDDIVSIYKGLHSTTPDVRVNAIEFLDNLLEPGLKKVLIPLIEHAILEPSSGLSNSFLHLNQPDEKECLRLLLNRPNPKVQQAVLYLIAQINDPAYLSLLNRVENNNQHISSLVEAVKMQLEQIEE